MIEKNDWISWEKLTNLPQINWLSTSSEDPSLTIQVGKGSENCEETISTQDI